MKKLELSPRHLDILPLLALGYSYSEIAEKLGIAENTVRGHIHSMLVRMNVLNATAAVAYAMLYGYIDITGSVFLPRGKF